MKSSSNGILLLLVFISFYILCLPKLSNAESSNNITIKFPFCIKDNDNQPLANSSCKSPKFSLYQNHDKLGFILELGNAGNFRVDEISYSSREIKLSDPNHCLPLKLLSLDFDAITPFVPVIQTKDFWVYNCSRIVGQHQEYDVIGCVSGGSISYTVVSVESGGENNVNDSDCKFVKKVYVPTSSDNGYDELSSYSSIELTWDETNCDSCESMDSTSDPPSKNDTSNTAASRSVKWLLVVGAIAFFAITCRVLWIWLLPQYSERNNEAPSNATTTDNTTPYTSPIHQTDHEVSGLNQSIMNSYPTVVIGKSGRGIKPPDDNCPICLGDYVPGDTLKILPECIHRFHVECIDLWFTSNATCPICRISPSHHNFSVA